MLRLKTYKYLIDGITQRTMVNLARALTVVPTIIGFKFNKATHVLIVEAASDPEDSVKLASEVVGAKFRTETRRTKTSHRVNAKGKSH